MMAYSIPRDLIGQSSLSRIRHLHYDARLKCDQPDYSSGTSFHFPHNPCRRRSNTFMAFSILLSLGRLNSSLLVLIYCFMCLSLMLPSKLSLAGSPDQIHLVI